jgi:CRP-like cAMP-binding protein
MEYSAVKEAMKACPGLEELDAATMAQLFWIAKERTLSRGRTLYKQGDTLDGAFCVLLAGTLGVAVDGESVAELSPPILVGESAFATVSHVRGATVQVNSDTVTLLEFRPSEELLTSLNKLFSEVAWDRWLTVTRLAPG